MLCHMHADIVHKHAPTVVPAIMKPTALVVSQGGSILLHTLADMQDLPNALLFSLIYTLI